MPSEPLRLHGVPACTVITSLPLSGEDKAFCLDILTRLETGPSHLADQARLDLKRFCGELMVSALTLQTLLEVTPSQRG